MSQRKEIKAINAFSSLPTAAELEMELVIVGMSGGVDLSVATLLLAKEVRIFKDVLFIYTDPPIGL